MNWKLLTRRWHANIGIFSAITLGTIALSCFFIAHAKDVGIGKALMEIHYGKFLPPSTRWIWIDSQGLFLLGLVVSGWAIHYKARKQRKEAEAPGAPAGSLLVLYDSQTGAAEKVARTFNAEAESRGFRAFVTDMAKYRHDDLPAERWVFIVSGAPANGQVFRQFISGPRAPKLKELNFSVLAMQENGAPPAGEEFDAKLEKLGASRLHARVDCTAEDEKAPRAWMDAVFATLNERAGAVRRGKSASNS